MRTLLMWFVIIFVVILSPAPANSAPAILHPVDFLALQTIRKSLSETPGSSFFSSWDFTGDPCGFSGVLCLSGRVVSLSLGELRAGSPGLTGHLHPAVGNLEALTELSLVPGRVYGRIPASLVGLRNLRFLALSRNFFSGEIPAGIGEMRGLRTLDLSFNLLTGRIPAGVWRARELTNVVLCHNRLAGRVPEFGGKLVRLDLKNNGLSGWVGKLPGSLQYLSLSSNRLSGHVNRFLPRLTRLNYLDLSMNHFSGPIPGVIFSFPISHLQLQRNKFSGPLRPIGHIATTQTVDLSYNRLTGTIPGSLSSVRNLYLNNNRFTGKVPRFYVTRLLGGTIRVLYLQHNYLTGIEMDRNTEIPVTTSLCLQYNCMVPPVQSPCPTKAGKQISRPPSQCR